MKKLADLIHREPAPAAVHRIAGEKKGAETPQNRIAVMLQRELFLDCISVLLLAWGLVLAADRLTVLESGLWETLLLAAGSLLVLLVIRLRWWIAPLLAGGFFLEELLRHYLLKDLPEWAAWWLGFFQWSAEGLPSHPLYSENGSILLLRGALAFAVTAVVFILVRKLFSFPVVLGLVAGSMIAVYAVSRTDLSVPLCIAVAGLIVLLPRVYARYVEKSSGGRGEPRGSMQVIALPVAALAVAVALLVPADTSAWRSAPLNNLVTDIGYLFQGPFGRHASASSNFSLTRLGFVPEGDRLGGPVTLTDDMMLTVEADRPVLLRGAVADFYTGDNWWIGAPDGDFRWGSLFWLGYRREAFDRDKPLGGREARELYDRLCPIVTVQMQYENNRFSTLFSPGTAQDFSTQQRELEDLIYFNMRSELYLHGRIPGRTVLEVEARTWNREAPGFEEDFLALAAIAGNREDANLERVQSRCLQLPEELPDSVRELAAELVEGIDEPYLRAVAIESWLAENMEYNLEPELPPANSDFVAYFLETGEGYCTYYASAMAVLARCAGIPSRYVTGFGLERHPIREDAYAARGNTAHAWAELYFQGIGWVPFDPLQWDSDEPLNIYVPLPELPEEEMPEAISGQEDLPQAEALPELPALPGEESDYIVPAVAAFLGLLLGIVLLRVGIWAVMTGKSRAYRLERILRRYSSMEKRFEVYYRDILRQLALLGLEPRPGETLATFPARVDRRIRLEEADFTAVAAVQMRISFAETQPALEEVRSAAAYHTALEGYLRRTMSRFAYFFRRGLQRQ
ncbi:MAG: transglutaminase-like domain-containing protein [Oscillospiraceae bacterium]